MMLVADKVAVFLLVLWSGVLLAASATLGHHLSLFRRKGTRNWLLLLLFVLLPLPCACRVLNAAIFRGASVATDWQSQTFFQVCRLGLLQSNSFA